MDRIKYFKKIMERTGSDKIIILTAHYNIKGRICDFEDCNKDEYLNLTHVTLCRYEESYGQNCEKTTETNYDWLHINLDNIIAFSFVKD